jgi:hypothetical protein
MHTNKVSHVRTIDRVAKDLGEDVDFLFDVAMEMETEDGVICAGFWTPAAAIFPRGRTAGVQKAPGHEVAVSRAGGQESSAMGISGWRRIR